LMKKKFLLDRENFQLKHGNDTKQTVID
jgi:hypothetical protein